LPSNELSELIRRNNFLLEVPIPDGSFGNMTWRQIMKRFIISTLCVSVFFVGLGFLVEKVGARFKSDEKALELIKAARTAIGGDSAVAGVQSLRIKGSSVNTWKMRGTEKTEPGEIEIALQLPDKLSKSIKIGSPDGEKPETRIVNKQVETVILRRGNGDDQIGMGKGEGNGTGVGVGPGGKRIVIENTDGTLRELRREENGNVIVGPGERKVAVGDANVKQIRVDKEKMEAEHAAMRQNEIFRLTLGLLLSPPANIEANYRFGGERDVEGTPCNLVIAEILGSSIKLFLNRDTNLPVMMAYSGEAMPQLVNFKTKVPAPGDDNKDVIFFARPGIGEPTPMELHFSDYRNVGGLQLPYHWTTWGGDMTEEFNVTSYEVNPADIANSFETPKENQKIELRVKKTGQ